MSFNSSVNKRAKRSIDCSEESELIADDLCFRCGKVKTHPGLLCKRCCNPIKAICENLRDPICKMLYDAIWVKRADRRETLVKKVAE